MQKRLADYLGIPYPALAVDSSDDDDESGDKNATLNVPAVVAVPGECIGLTSASDQAFLAEMKRRGL
jgi:hypothetical protein